MKRPRAAFARVTGSAAAFAGIGVMRYPAGAAEFNFKLGVDVVAEHPVAARAIEAAAKVTQQSGGRLEVHVFPNSILGSQEKIVSMMRLGGLEMGLAGDATVENTLTVVGITGVPFAFAGFKDAWNAMDGRLGNFVRAAIVKNLGLYVFSKSWEAGFRQLENSLRPVHIAGDAKGLKIRVPESYIETSLWKALGVSPATVEGSQQYLAVQTHLVDGTEVPLAVIDSRHMYEVEKYISMTNHMWTNYQLYANADAMQKLPKDLHDLVDRTFNAGAVASREDFVRMDQSTAAHLKTQGAIINDTDRNSFKAALHAAGVYPGWRDHYGAEAWGLLEASVGPLR